MLKKLLITLIIFISLQACNVGGSGIWKNENIDKAKRDEIHALNEKLFKSIINNDVAGVRSLMSGKLLEKGSIDLDQLIKRMSSSIEADNYRTLDEYNVKNSTTGIANTLPSGFSGDNDYVINYQALNKEMYVSLILCGRDSEILTTAIYGKYDSEWKINILQFGQYSLFKKPAPEYYKLAKASYDKSHLIDAVNLISISKQCLNPANNFFHYQKEKEINEFHELVMKEVDSKYQLPLTLGNITTKPKVFRIFPEMISEGFFPMVYYQSQINLNDTSALKLENKQVKKEVSRLFTGIDQDKKFVFYWAFNTMPDGKTPVEHFGFIDKLK